MISGPFKPAYTCHERRASCRSMVDVVTTATFGPMCSSGMFNPRNSYQNYPVAVNCSNRIKYAYLGSLLLRMVNANYSASGELSPLLNDPDLRTIGMGTRILPGGTMLIQGQAPEMN
ncbi:MAG: hypothetical protein GY790_09970 [Bacteroidetes bacterium]|nr:hypothetical protein [Bacteroidota bacterium]